MDDAGQTVQTALARRLPIYRAAADFKWAGKYVFPDFWEVDSEEYAHRFVWCCYALAWGIERYDASKVAEAVPA